MSAAERYLWGWVVPGAAIVLAAALVLPALWLPASPPADAAVFLAMRLWRAHPEPREQLRYTLAVTAVPIFLWWAAIRTPRPAGAAGAMVVRTAFALVVAAAAAYQERYVAPLFGLAAMGLAVAVSSALAIVASRWRRPRDATRADRGVLSRAAWVPALVAAGVAAAYLLPSVYREGMRRVDLHVWLHLPIQLGEPATVWAGSTPLVDYVPQYQLLISYLLLPVCRALGPSIATLTSSMAVLSFVGLMAVYRTFCRLTANAWSALLLFLPFVGISFVRVHPASAPERLSAFTYFAVGPDRLLGPWLTFATLAWFLERPAPGRRVLVVVVGTIAALNNLDFGLPALAGALVAIALCEMPTPDISVARLGTLLGTLAAAGTAALALLMVGSRMRAGQWPDLRQLVLYQRAYAAGGYMMLPLPPFGFHWVLYATHMAAIAQGLLGRSQTRVYRGLLLFAGIFGAGASFYYIGRSHPEVLVLVLSPWALSLALLAFGVLDQVRRREPGDETQGSPFAMTSALVGAAWLLGAWQLRDLPNPGSQVERIRDMIPATVGAPVVNFGTMRVWSPDVSATWVELIQSHTRPGEDVAIIYPFGHVLGRRAGVQNVYPYTDDESFVLVAQLRELMQRIAVHDVHQVFGRINEPLAAALTAAGFHQASTQADFAWWTRDAGPVDRSAQAPAR